MVFETIASACSAIRAGTGSNGSRAVYRKTVPVFRMTYGRPIL